MAHITWELQQGIDRVGWIGKVGERTAFVAEPDGVEAWELRFTWTGSVFGPLPTVAKTREIAEQKLALFAESTGMALPPEVEEEPTLAQDLVKGFKGEMQWFKAEDSEERRAEYLGTQALMKIEKWLRKHRAAVDDEIKDPEYHGAIGVLRDLVEEVWEAQEELGLEVDRDWPED